jgi:hypothetical protein
MEGEDVSDSGSLLSSLQAMRGIHPAIFARHETAALKKILPFILIAV